MKPTIEEINARRTKHSEKFISEMNGEKCNPNDSIPKIILDNLDKYPEYHYPNLILIDEIINEDGSRNRLCIMKDGNENDPKTRTTFNEAKPGDEECARLEIEQFEKGVLKEISPHTVLTHKANGKWNTIKHLPLATNY